MRHLESKLQQACVRWARLQYPICRKQLFSVPNGIHTSPTQAQVAYAEGMVAGVSDLILLYPSADHRFYALCIEMKTAKGKQSDYQKAWQKSVEAPGCYQYALVRSFEEFKTTINNYLKCF